ncbi:glycosyltransferase [Luminiphilus sp.]|nr:glycosyltransferase [Luminiphilus sp.]
MPTLSILIPSFNDERIFRAIHSLEGREEQRVQIVVQDAGSKPELIDRIKSCLDGQTDKLIVESDEGIFDGINKGIKNCDGEFILTIGSDDVCPLELITSFLEVDDNQDLTLYNVKMFDKNGVVRRFWPASPFSRMRYRLGIQYPHFGMILRSSIYHEIGLFNHHNKINADYEFFDNLTKKENLRTRRDTNNSIYMQLGGTSTENGWRVLQHQRLILKYILMNSPDLVPAIFLKWFYKLNQVYLARRIHEKVPF